MKRLAVLPALLLPLAAPAVVATTSKAQPAAIALGWAGVGQMGGASAVAIGPHLVLTAAHVAATDFLLGGAIYHLGSSADAPKVKKSAVDLRLVTVKEAMPTWYALASSVKKGATVTMVGFGGAGVVDAKGDGYAIGGGGEHAGTNTVSDKNSVSGLGPTLRAALKKAGDAVLTGGDSGGGWFVGNALVGISDFTYTTSKKTKPYVFTKKGDFGSGAIDLTDGNVRKWLLSEIAASAAATPKVLRVQSVPEPTTWAILGIGAVGFLRRRRIAAGDRTGARRLQTLD